MSPTMILYIAAPMLVVVGLSIMIVARIIAPGGLLFDEGSQRLAEHFGLEVTDPSRPVLRNQIPAIIRMHEFNMTVCTHAIVQGKLDEREFVFTAMRFVTNRSNSRYRHQYELQLLIFPHAARGREEFHIGPAVSFDGTRLDDPFLKWYSCEGHAASIQRFVREPVRDYLAGNRGWKIDCAQDHLVFQRQLWPQVKHRRWWKLLTIDWQAIHLDLLVENCKKASWMVRQFDDAVADVGESTSK